MGDDSAVALTSAIRVRFSPAIGMPVAIGLGSGVTVDAPVVRAAGIRCAGTSVFRGLRWACIIESTFG